MNNAISNPEVQDYLRKHLTLSPTVIALRKSPFSNISAGELANQLDGLKRSRKKLPLWFNTPGIYYPNLLAIEQASSALTAMYKGKLIPAGAKLIDLSGGFGVDSYYFSKQAKEVIHCEQNVELSQIAAHNTELLGANNITFFAGDGISYLATQSQQFDVIYIDPSRRIKQQKVFRLSDCEPDVVNELTSLLRKTKYLLIKAAPLLDITAALKELENVKEVHIISVQNECKELLFIVEVGYNQQPDFHCVALTNKGEELFIFSERQEIASCPIYKQPQHYLYEPDTALLKGGCFRYIAVAFNLYKLNQHTHLYTADYVNPSFIGRTFEVISTEDYTIFKKNKALLTANVSTRNFPLKPEALKKKHHIKDGGPLYLFFCTGPRGELLVISCRKLSSPAHS